MPTNMPTSETALTELEQWTDRIIQSHQQLVLQNKSLRKKITSLTDELVTLTAKKNNAIQTLKKMLIQLKDQLACQQK